MDHRRRTRVSAHKHTTVSWSGGECRGELVNLSLKGCLLGPQEGAAPPAGEEVAVRIHLESDAPDLDVQVHARVVRQDAAGMAVDFMEIELESFRHLFRLVQYNAPDPDSIEEELGTSAFSPPGTAGT